MQAPTILGCLLVAVICTFKAEGCETDIASSNVEYLRDLLQKDTKLFQKQVFSQMPDDAPSLQNLTQMFNEMNNGKVPKFITDNNYTLILNSTGNFSYSYNNQGKANTTMYSMLGTVGKHKSFSLLEFGFFKGSVSVNGKTYPYDAGTAFIINGCYIGLPTFVRFKASVFGAIIHSPERNGTYFSHGNYTGFSQGDFKLHQFKKEVKERVSSYGLFSNSLYNSSNEIFVTGKTGVSNFTNIMELTSLTGGTNGTMTIKSSADPNDKSTWNSTIEGSLKNAIYSSTLGYDSVSKSPFAIDITNLSSQATLSQFLSAARLGTDVYLPVPS